ncbi:unnamed protein product [Withania somnifera]
MEPDRWFDDEQKTSSTKKQEEQDFVTFDDWDFDVEEETTIKNVLYVKETTYNNKKARTSLISSLNILKDFGNGFRRLKGKRFFVKLSTDEILRLGGQKFIQSTEQTTSVSSLDHPFTSSLLSLSEEESRNVELVERLLASAEKIGDKQYDHAINLLNECEKLSSKTGNPVERLVYYFSRALRERVDRERETGEKCTKGLGIHGMRDLQDTLRSINACTIAVHDIPICQVVKFAGIQAIVENVGNSKKIHIIDLEIKIGAQWTILMQALATHQKSSQNPLGYLKITALLDIVDLKREDLDIDPEEAIAVSSQYFLSNMIMQQDRLDFLMGLIKGLNPRIVIIAEIEANLNSPVFVNRFIEALLSNVAWNKRTIRHVTMGMWREYLMRFGTEEIKMSNSSLYQAKTVVERFSDGNSFTLEMNENYIAIGWKGTPLNSVSAWKFRKSITLRGGYLIL